MSVYNLYVSTRVLCSRADIFEVCTRLIGAHKPSSTSPRSARAGARTAGTVDHLNLNYKRQSQEVDRELYYTCKGSTSPGHSQYITVSGIVEATE